MFRNTLRNLMAHRDKGVRRARRQVPEVVPLEGRALLSAVGMHAPRAHAALVHRLAARHASVVHHIAALRAARHGFNTMQVTVLSTAADTPTPITPLQPGQFGPNTPFPFPGIRDGGALLL